MFRSKAEVCTQQIWVLHPQSLRLHTIATSIHFMAVPPSTFLNQAWTRLNGHEDHISETQRRSTVGQECRQQSLRLVTWMLGWPLAVEVSFTDQQTFVFLCNSDPDSQAGCQKCYKLLAIASSLHEPAADLNNNIRVHDTDNLNFEFLVSQVTAQATQYRVDTTRTLDSGGLV